MPSQLANNWANQQTALYDPGAASAGVQLTLASCAINTWTTASSLTVTFGNSLTAAAYTLIELRSDVLGGYIDPTKTGGAANAGAATGTPTVTTSSITSGQVVIGTGGAESGDTWAGDADTTNGNWSTHQHNAGGTGTSGMSVTSQQKVVTSTATQTYNPTLTAADCILLWASFQEQTGQVAEFTLQGGGVAR
jgi:hypothetical protein